MLSVIAMYLPSLPLMLSAEELQVSCHNYIGTEAGMHAMRQLATHAVNKIVMDQSDIDVGAMLGQKAQN